ncbi:MAG: hypothetical protein GXP48_02175 [Acidobacteria bacterium]|nr:hypothetical protein [Acidobacteriota bacterium]
MTKVELPPRWHVRNVGEERPAPPALLNVVLWTSGSFFPSSQPSMWSPFWTIRMVNHRHVGIVIREAPAIILRTPS